MGKGYENYMSKKWFHPTNIGNMKRIFMAEQKSTDEKKRQQELREQYEREQELFSNKQLMGDEKARLGLSFMYNPPAGMAKQDEQQQLQQEQEIRTRDGTLIVKKKKMNQNLNGNENTMHHGNLGQKMTKKFAINHSVSKFEMFVVLNVKNGVTLIRIKFVHSMENHV